MEHRTCNKIDNYYDGNDLDQIRRDYCKGLLLSVSWNLTCSIGTLFNYIEISPRLTEAKK